MENRQLKRGGKEQQNEDARHPPQEDGDRDPPVNLYRQVPKNMENFQPRRGNEKQQNAMHPPQEDGERDHPPPVNLHQQFILGGVLVFFPMIVIIILIGCLVTTKLYGTNSDVNDAILKILFSGPLILLLIFLLLVSFPGSFNFKLVGCSCFGANRDTKNDIAFWLVELPLCLRLLISILHLVMYILIYMLVAQFLYH